MKNNIREYRAVNDMTQQELADAAGISRTCLSLIETEAVNPCIETVKKIAKAMDVDWHVLVK